MTWTSESTRDRAAFERIPLPLYTKALGPHCRTFGLAYHLLSRFSVAGQGCNQYLCHP